MDSIFLYHGVELAARLKEPALLPNWLNGILYEQEVTLHLVNVEISRVCVCVGVEGNEE